MGLFQVAGLIIFTFSFFSPAYGIMEGVVTDGSQSSYSSHLLLTSVRIGLASVDAQGNPSGFYGDCSGTITASNQISTAAHCFNQINNPFGRRYFAEVRFPDGSRRLISLNSVQSRGDIAPMMQEMGQRSSNPSARQVDMVMATLSESLGDEHITPFCNDSVDINSEYIAAGFGITTAGQTIPQTASLRHATIRMEESREGVIISQPNQRQARSSGEGLATGGNSTTCNGDSGGGLFINQSQLCLAGVVSGGYPQEPDNCGDPNKRQVFARTNSTNRGRLIETIDLSVSAPVFQTTDEVPATPKPRSDH